MASDQLVISVLLCLLLLATAQEHSFAPVSPVYRGIEPWPRFLVEGNAPPPVSTSPPVGPPPPPPVILKHDHTSGDLKECPIAFKSYKYFGIKSACSADKYKENAAFNCCPVVTVWMAYAYTDYLARGNGMPAAYNNSEQATECSYALQVQARKRGGNHVNINDCGLSRKNFRWWKCRTGYSFGDVSREADEGFLGRAVAACQDPGQAGCKECLRHVVELAGRFTPIDKGSNDCLFLAAAALIYRSTSVMPALTNAVRNCPAAGERLPLAHPKSGPPLPPGTKGGSQGSAPTPPVGGPPTGDADPFRSPPEETSPPPQGNEGGSKAGGGGETHKPKEGTQAPPPQALGEGGKESVAAPPTVQDGETLGGVKGFKQGGSSEVVLDEKGTGFDRALRVGSGIFIVVASVILASHFAKRRWGSVGGLSQWMQHLWPRAAQGYSQVGMVDFGEEVGQVIPQAKQDGSAGARRVMSPRAGDAH